MSKSDLLARTVYFGIGIPSVTWALFWFLFGLPESLCRGSILDSSLCLRIGVLVAPYLQIAIIMMAIAISVLYWYLFLVATAVETGNSVFILRWLPKSLYRGYERGTEVPLLRGLNGLAVMTGLFLSFALTFAGVMLFLHLRELLTLRAQVGGADVSYMGVFVFHLWVFTDMIPILDIPETLQWSPPYTYDGALAGWLLLSWKATVVLPFLRVGLRVLRREPR